MFLHTMKVCLTCILPITILQHVNPTGYKACPVVECTYIVGTVLKDRGSFNFM